MISFSYFSFVAFFKRFKDFEINDSALGGWMEGALRRRVESDVFNVLGRTLCASNVADWKGAFAKQSEIS